MSPVRFGDTGIPRLQELSFLQVAMEAVLAEASYDDIRLALVDHAASRRTGESDFDGYGLKRFARANPSKFASNATEALAELMRLGMLDRAPLPSTKQALEAYRGRRYTATPKGGEWGALLDRSLSAAYDSLLGALWHRHSQFAGYLSLLGRGVFTVPTAGWLDANRPMAGSEGRGHYVRFLLEKTIAAVSSGDLGWSASEPEIERAIHDYTEARLKFAESRRRPNPFARSRDFVRACEEALVTFAMRCAGLQVDYISLEILRRWTRDLGVANFSYHVPGPTALRLWLTADFSMQGDDPLLKRHVGDEWVDRATSDIPAAFERTRRRMPEQSWVPIYSVRGLIGVSLGVSDAVFDAALQRFISRAGAGEVPYRVNLEIFDSGAMPPTERPFRHRDPMGREQTYHRINITSVEDRRSV